MIAVVDVLLVDEVGADALGTEASPQRVQVLALKLGRELVHELVGVHRRHRHSHRLSPSPWPCPFAVVGQRKPARRVHVSVVVVVDD